VRKDVNRNPYWPMYQSAMPSLPSGNQAAQLGSPWLT
jgi:hypothetical protein